MKKSAGSKMIYMIIETKYVAPIQMKLVRFTKSYLDIAINI